MSKASWDVRDTKIFIEQCIEKILKKERQGGSFTRDGWKNILAGFNEKSGKSYDKKQMKNRYDNLKKEWRAWDKLFSKETGISYDSANNKVVAEDEWWDRKIKEDPAYAKYRYNGLRFARELDIIFKDIVAYGSNMFSPAATQQMSLGDDEEDGYRPTMDLEEGSGDSEKELQGPTTGVDMEVPIDLDDINLTTRSLPSAPSGSGSSGKRKRGEGSKAGKKKRISVSKQIADAMSVIADAFKDRAHALKDISGSDVSIKYVCAELQKILEVASDCDFRWRCYNMMMHDMCRDVFEALKEDKDGLLDWLHYHAYNTPSWQEPPKD